MVIKNRIMEFKRKKFKDVKPGECFVTIDPAYLLTDGFGECSIYMKTNEGTSIDLMNGTIYRVKYDISDMIAYSIILEATIKPDIKE